MAKKKSSSPFDNITRDLRRATRTVQRTASKVEKARQQETRKATRVKPSPQAKQAANAIGNIAGQLGKTRPGSAGTRPASKPPLRKARRVGRTVVRKEQVDRNNRSRQARAQADQDQFRKALQATAPQARREIRAGYGSGTRKNPIEATIDDALHGGVTASKRGRDAPDRAGRQLARGMETARRDTVRVRLASEKIAADTAAAEAKKKKAGRIKLKGVDAQKVPFGAALASVGLFRPGIKIAEVGINAAKNAPGDASNILINAVPSTIQFASDAYHNPKGVPKALAQPYIDLAKNPQKFFEENPVSTALMVAPGYRVPANTVGRGLRLAGKQKIQGATAHLPGYATKEVRTRSKDPVINAVQAKRDKKDPTPEIKTSVGFVQRIKKGGSRYESRIDHDWHVARAETDRRVASARRDAGNKALKKEGATASNPDVGPRRRDLRRLDEDARARVVEAMNEKERQVRKGARKHRARVMGREHGATVADARVANARAAAGNKAMSRMGHDVADVRRGPQRKDLEPLDTASRNRVLRAMDAAEDAAVRMTGDRPVRLAVQKPRVKSDGTVEFPEATVFRSKENAQLVATAMNESGDFLPAIVLKGKKGEWRIVPESMRKRLEAHDAVGTTESTIAKIMRDSRHGFSSTVLPTSVRWLAGQVTEGTFRSLVAGAGPGDYIRFKRIVKEKNRRDPGSGDKWANSVLQGGQAAKTGLAREYGAERRSLAENYKGTSFEKPAAAVTRFGQWRVPRVTRKAWGAYTKTVFDQINNRVEQGFRKAMVGQAVKNDFMDRSIIGLSDKAVKQAADNLKGTETQYHLAQQLHRMYGKYNGFSKGQRETLLHWTPFAPWMVNSVRFLTDVLPRDHPTVTALMTAATQIEKDWIKANKMDPRQEDHRPYFLQGTFPLKGGRTLPVHKMTPFGAAPEILENAPRAALGQVLPQFMPAAQAILTGQTWKGAKIKGADGGDSSAWRDGAVAASYLLGSHVPLVGMADRLTGATARLEGHPLGTSTRYRIRSLWNPFEPYEGSASGRDEGARFKAKKKKEAPSQPKVYGQRKRKAKRYG